MRSWALPVCIASSTAPRSSPYERAIELNPNDADILAEMGDALTIHRAERAGSGNHSARAMDLNPLYPDWYLWLLGGIYFNLGDYQRAIETLEQMSDRSEAHRLLASSYAHLGKLAEGAPPRRAADERCIRISRLLTGARCRPIKDQEPLERLIAGLRKAGLR